MLAKHYGADKVSKQRRSVCIEFPFSADEDRVMSFDVVPSFTKGDHYEIPDQSTVKGWTETNPKIHAEKATEANENFDGEWKGMVRMVKAWNNEKGKPVKPSFLLEVMFSTCCGRRSTVISLTNSCNCLLLLPTAFLMNGRSLPGWDLL